MFKRINYIVIVRKVCLFRQVYSIKATEGIFTEKFSHTLCMCLTLLPSTAFAEDPEFHAGDIAEINKIIDTYDLDLPKADPADGSYAPNEWSTGLPQLVFWTEVSPKRVRVLDVSNKDLTGFLDVSGLTALDMLFCNDNQLHSLNLSGLTSLKTLQCSNNQLHSLNLSGLTSLDILSCSSNQLQSLNVSSLTVLTELNCTNNELTSLDVSGSTALKYLYCYNNKLTSLNVRDLKNLKRLDCQSNLLTSLDVSGLTALETLECSGNQLQSLNLSGLTSLAELDSSKNQLTGLTLNNAAPYSKINVIYNFMEDTSAVNGRDIQWDENDFVFYPQNGNNIMIIYDKNDGTGKRENSTLLKGERVQLPFDIFKAPEGKFLKAWAVKTADGLQLQPWDSHPFYEDTTVYAIWEDLPKVNVKLYGHDDIHVTWDALSVEGYTVYYRVEYMRSTWDDYEELTEETTDTYYKQPNLEAGARYKFRVTPYIKINEEETYEGEPSESSYIYILKKIAAPRVSKSSRNYVRLRWTNIPGESGYQISRSRYKTKRFSTVKRVSYKYSTTRIKTPRNRRYYYKIRAYKTVDGKRIYAPWSAVRSYRLR
ncbi:MAG TPA: hypothetical protein GX736_04110 [Mogibacterium sp.]|nr:hypothetical protein [Mogibacterium sp.]